MKIIFRVYINYIYIYIVICLTEDKEVQLTLWRPGLHVHEHLSLCSEVGLPLPLQNCALFLEPASASGPHSLD